MNDTALVQLLATLRADKWLAHQALFPHRHTNASPAFHKAIIEAWNSSSPYVVIKGFRGAAKSTLAEETLTILSLFQDSPYSVIVGNSYAAAVNRLASIKHEFDSNEHIQALFGGVRGSTWAEDVITLSNGCRIQAFGRGQSLRGAKDPVSNRRPTLVLVDDFEDAESAATADGRQKAYDWILRELLPALDPDARVRVIGTPLHTESVIERLCADPTWKAYVFPVYVTRGDPPERIPLWPDRFPLTKIDAIEAGYMQAGDAIGFAQEYLCRPVSAASAVFDPADVTIDPRQPAWLPRILIVDPARTIKASSARTGYVVISWYAEKLVVHEAMASHDSPAQQIDRIFDLCRIHRPMLVAVEADGLEEWLMQPLRAEMLKRQEFIPLQAVRAPKGKEQFIAALQPFFRAKQVVWTRDFPDLRFEVKTFPAGKIDTLNALAYALRVRPGAPVYGDFGERHVRPYTPNSRLTTLWLVFNATPQTTTCVAAMVRDGLVHVIRDYVLDAAPAEGLQAALLAMSDLVREQRQAPKMLIPEERAAQYDATQLAFAFRQRGLQPLTGASDARNVGALTDWLRQGRFFVAEDAAWTLNGLAGGYYYPIDKTIVASQPQNNVYRPLIGSLESFARMLSTLLQSETELDNEPLHYEIAPNGRRYISMRR